MEPGNFSFFIQKETAGILKICGYTFGSRNIHPLLPFPLVIYDHNVDRNVRVDRSRHENLAECRGFIDKT